MIENQELLEACTLLEEACSTHADDDEVSDFFRCISPVIEDVRAGRITPPVEWGEIPCFLYFTEGTLQRFPEIENAYARFKISMTGGMPQEIQDWIENSQG
jgi:hypothetical protein